VEWQADSGDFVCSGHGARFDVQGKVKLGPANRPLRAIEVSVATDGTVTYRR
jgi:Rieske Fe-S protein